MNLSFRVSDPSAPPKPYPIFYWTVVILTLLLLRPVMGADMESVVIDSAEFNETFNAYYNALDGYTSEDL